MSMSGSSQRLPLMIKVIVWGTLAMLVFNISDLLLISHYGYKTASALLVPSLGILLFSLFFIIRRSRFGKALFHVAFAMWAVLSVFTTGLLQIAFAAKYAAVDPFFIQTAGLLVGQLFVLLVFNLALASKQLASFWR